MQLVLGQLIIDTTDNCKDTGIVIEVYEDSHGDNIYGIYWVCPRGGCTNGERENYTTTLHYTEEELDVEYSHCFEVIG
mgnify:CR=1 FL=1